MKKLLIIFSVLFTSTLYAGDKLSTLDTTILFGESTVETVTLDKKAMMDIEGKGFSGILDKVKPILIEYGRRHAICSRTYLDIRRAGAANEYYSFMLECMSSFD